MKAAILLLGAMLISSAYAEPITDRDRAIAVQRQAAQQQHIDRARERCIANRGTDCDTLDGLQEWLLLDRSRADAVLDRISPGSSSAGASAPPVVNPSAPATSPRNVP